MAVRLNPRNAESVRQRIKVGQLVDRVQKHALGETQMSKSELNAARFLINKRMPNPPEDTNVNLNAHGSIQIEFVGAQRSIP